MVLLARGDVLCGWGGMVAAPGRGPYHTIPHRKSKPGEVASSAARSSTWSWFGWLLRLPRSLHVRCGERVFSAHQRRRWEMAPTTAPRSLQPQQRRLPTPRQSRLCGPRRRARRATRRPPRRPCRCRRRLPRLAAETLRRSRLKRPWRRTLQPSRTLRPCRTGWAATRRVRGGCGRWLRSRSRRRSSGLSRVRTSTTSAPSQEQPPLSPRTGSASLLALSSLQSPCLSPLLAVSSRSPSRVSILHLLQLVSSHLARCDQARSGSHSGSSPRTTQRRSARTGAPYSCTTTGCGTARVSASCATCSHPLQRH